MQLYINKKMLSRDCMHRAWLIKTFSGVWACFFLQDIVPFGHKCFYRISYPLGTNVLTGYRTLWAQMNLLVWHCWAWCVGQWCAVWMTFSGACLLGRLVRVHVVCRPDRVVARVCILAFVCGFYRPHPSSWFVFFWFVFKKDWILYGW